MKKSLSRIFLKTALLAATVSISLLPERSLALDPSYDILQYNCQNWGRQNGLPVNGVNAIAQTKDGYLWLGTAAGLVRFDGEEFKLMDLARVAKLRNSGVNSLAPAKTGGLWVGLENSAFGFCDGQSFQFQGTAERGGVNLNVRSIFQGRDGSLWLAAEGHLARLTPAGNYEDTLGSFTNASLNLLCGREDSLGRIWMGAAAGADAGSGVHYWQAGRLVRLNDPALDAAAVLCLTEDTNHQLWVGTSQGLFCYDSNLERKIIPALSEEVRALLVDHHGVLWVGTSGRGLGRVQNGAFSFMARPEGLSGDYVRCLAEDREGSLWVGTRSGVSQLSDVKFPTEHAAEDPAVKDAWAVAPSRDGGVWVGSSSGLSYLDGKAKTYSITNGLPTGLVRRIFEAGNGDVYLASGNSDLVVFSGEKVVARYAAPGMVVGLAEDEHGVVASVGGSLYRVDTNYFTPYPLTNGDACLGGWVLDLAPDHQGGIWVACNAGIVHVKDGVGQPCGAPGDLPDARVQGVCEDSDGVVWAWLLTGIARLKDNQIRCIDREHGLFDDNIYAIVPDDLGYLWVNSGRGIFRVSRKNINDFADGKTSRVDCVVYDGPDDVKSTDQTVQERVGGKTPDGRVWFPSPNGVVEIDPAHIPGNPFPPPVHLTSLRANGVMFDTKTNIVAPPGKGELEIHFAALSFVAPQETRFRYRLEGYDKDWVEITDRRMAFYTNLKPGRYQFQVTAANSDGVWNEEGDTVEIELRPHYYQTAWFDLLCGGLGCGGLAVLYFRRVRRRQLKQQESQAARELLRAEVERQTAELAGSRAFLQSLVDQLPVGIFRKDKAGRYVFVNNWYCRSKEVQAQDLLGLTPKEFALCHIPEDQHEARELTMRGCDHHDQIMRTGQQIELEDFRPDLAGGGKYLHVVKSPVLAPDGTVEGSLGIVVDFTQRKLAEQELEKLHQRLLETSRLAGMTEIASNVLHNVGNVLNSVNVSASLVMARVRNSNVVNLAKVAALLREHQQDLADFITHDPKGKHLPPFLLKLSEHLLADQEAGLRELELLRGNIEHINEIVAMQQNYAKVSGVKETIKIDSLVEDSLRMNLGALNRHGVEVVRDYGNVPPVPVEKHKVLQILVNLVRNAKYACDESGRADKRLTVRVANGGGSIKISVLDNGVGIPPENLSRIFNHGFTTRKNGHGFGLHSGALAAKEMGGSLSVKSDGPGHGAVFTLELPVSSPDGAA